MTEIMISIKPEWVQKIFHLRKTWEVRITRPKYSTPFKCYIYQTGNGGVIGEFTCDEIQEEFTDELSKEWLKDTEVTLQEAVAYANGRVLIYKWRIRSIVEYSEPRPLSIYGLAKPPRSWCYINPQWEEVEGVHMENGNVVIEPKEAEHGR